MIDKIIISVGLLFDIIGAVFVAWEVVRQYHGRKFNSTSSIPNADYLGSDGTPVVVSKAKESDEFVDWEKNKYLKMKIGLSFLIFGFILQSIGLWI